MNELLLCMDSLWEKHENYIRVQISNVWEYAQVKWLCFRQVVIDSAVDMTID